MRAGASSTSVFASMLARTVKYVSARAADGRPRRHRGASRERVARGVLARHRHRIGVDVDRPDRRGAERQRDQREDAAATSHVENGASPRARRRARRAPSATRRVVSCSPVPNARPGSSSITRSPASATYSRHGGRTTIAPQMRKGSKCFFHSSRHSSPTTCSRRGAQAAGSPAIASRAAASVREARDERHGGDRRDRRDGLFEDVTAMPFEGRRGRPSAAPSAANERRRVALFEALGAELEEERAGLVGLGGGDVDRDVRIAGLGRRVGRGRQKRDGEVREGRKRSNPLRRAPDRARMRRLSRSLDRSPRSRGTRAFGLD